MKKGCLIITGILLLIISVYAEVPKLISHQGRLTDSNDNALNGTYSIKFRLYEAETGGSAIWTETQSSVTVTNGIYNVYLGSSSSLQSLAFDKQYWLSIEVNSDGEMTPRSKLTNSAYAFRSIYSDTATSATTLSGYSSDNFLQTTGGSLTGNVTTTGNITASKFYGDGSNLTGINVTGTDTSQFLTRSEVIAGDSISGGNISITGTITATTFYGDGSSLTGISTSSIDTTQFLQKTDSIAADSISAGTISGNMTVSGSLTATSFSGDGSGLTNVSGSTDSDWTISSDNMYSGVSGNVGIGTSSPYGKLHIKVGDTHALVIDDDNGNICVGGGLSSKTNLEVYGQTGLFLFSPGTSPMGGPAYI